MILSKRQMETIKILLVEDHVVVRESIRQALIRDPNLQIVGEAGDGEEAVKLAGQLKPDIIIMDIAMPKLNGIEATKKIKAQQSSIAILALTAYDYEQYIFPLLEAGAAGYLLKDISSSQLIDAVHTVHHGESVLHPSITRKVVERFRSNAADREQNRAADILTERETSILKMAARGMGNKDIADDLHLSVRTVESHLGCIFNKLGVGSRTEAVIQAMKRGWFSLEELS